MYVLYIAKYACILSSAVICMYAIRIAAMYSNVKAVSYRVHRTIRSSASIKSGFDNYARNCNCKIEYN